MLLVAEMSWLRRILDKTRQDRICNEVIWKELGQMETLVDKIRKRKLTWFGRATRMDNRRQLASALYGHLEGTRSHGRETKTWMDAMGKKI